jgi:hypothetical protein
MKKSFLSGLLILNLLVAFSQTVDPRSIEDSVFGWMKVYHFKGATAPVKVDNKTYSIAQLSICDSFANWMQATYLPKGAMGDVKRSVTGKIGLYNPNDAALPQSYGAAANLYFFLRYNKQGKMEPENNLGVTWSIFANGVPGWPVRDISTPSAYYFTMPSFEFSHNSESTGKLYDLSHVPNLKPYTTFWVKNVEAGDGTNYVMISQDNRFPFVKLTKGEYLQLLEAAIPRFYEKEKKKILEQNRGNQKSIDYFTGYLDKKIEGFGAGLKTNREKYKDRLNETALTSGQPTLNDLDNARDVFSNGYIADAESTSGRIPVYKVDPAMAELCKKDKPQWIMVSWWWAANNPVEKYLHETIINSFNFDYVYQFFFDPEKVKGKQYKPLRSPLYKEAVVINEASAESKKNKGDKNIHFFEDFSTTAIGKKPVGWQSNLAAGGYSLAVGNPDELEGNWAIMNGDFKITPATLKPLPQNFTLSYDLVAVKDFTWGSKGLSCELSKETSPGNAESFVSLKLRPGFDGRDGEATLETKFPSPPGYSNGTKWYAAPGFSNNKKTNRITVTIKKSREMLQVFIDKTKIAEYEKAIPATLLFNALSFTSSSSGEKDKYYISNIKITKDQP